MRQACIDGAYIYRPRPIGYTSPMAIAGWRAKPHLVVLLVSTVFSVVRGQTTVGDTQNPAVDYCIEGTPLPQLPGTCSSCEGRCGETTQFSGRKYCACDSACAAYGDCCPDIGEKCHKEFSDGTNIRKRFHYHGAACRTYRSKFFSDKPSYPLFMIVDVCGMSGTKCNTSFYGDLLQSNLAIPIIDLDTGIHFINAECAICNGVKRGVPWNVTLDCNSDFNTTEVSTSGGLRDAIQSGVCSVFYPITQADFKPRQSCDDEGRNTCPKSCQNRELVQKCLSYEQTFTTSLSWNYRNYYCALCSHEKESDLNCSNIRKRGFNDGEKFRPFSLTVLFDFNPSNGLRVGVKARPCPPNHALVASDQTCRLVGCPEDQRLLNNSCVQSQINATLLVVVTFDDVSDSRRVLSFLANGSVLQVEFVDDMENGFRDILTGVSSSKDRVDLALLTTPEGDYQMNLTVLLRFMFDANSTFDPHGDLEAFKSNLSVLTNARLISLLEGLSIDITSVEIRVEDELTFHRLETLACTWVVYSTEDYRLSNGTLEIVGTDLKYGTERYRVVDSGPTLVCVDINEGNGVLLTITPVLGIISIVCITLSIICLLVRIVAQFLLPFFHSFAGTLQFHLCLALCAAFLCLLIGGAVANIRPNSVGCFIMAVFIYWTFLAAFTWMAVLALDSFLVFRPSASPTRPRDTGSKSLVISIIFGWGMPALVSIVVLGIDFSSIDSHFRPHFGKRICWFNERYALLIYFSSPVAVCSVVTLVLFGFTVVNLKRAFASSPKPANNKERHRVYVYLRLFFLMGVSWIFGFIAAFIGHTAFWIIFIILNALQGVLIFVSFFLKKRVFREIRTLTKANASSTHSVSPPVSSHIHS